MKKTFKLVAVAAVSCCILGAVSSCGEAAQHIVNVRVWNDEFQKRFRAYSTDYVKTLDNGDELLKDNVILRWNVTANDGGAYQQALDEVLAKNASASADDKVDLFLFEADAAKKYATSNYTLDVKSDLGMTDSEFEDQYKYTQDVVTDSEGALRGTSWQATPGLFAFRTDIADEVLGTHDPVAIQAKLSTWEGFNTVAAQMKEKGYFMLSGYDDSYRVFSNNVSSKWVGDDGKVNLDPSIKSWVDQTKDYTTKGYNHKTVLWDKTWTADQGPDSKVFGFFYSTWGINFTLAGNATKAMYGKWRVCEGPASWYWGGTWLGAAKDTDDQMLVKQIMRDLTTNKDQLVQCTKDTEDYTNTVSGMHSLATDSSFGSEFLGGQNHIALFENSAKDIELKYISAYDQGCNEKFQESMHDYFAGTATYDAAISSFKTKIQTYYPDIKGFNF
jgi:multiple sugar transport system substrate-binding protein